jgi:hypothetical protein
LGELAGIKLSPLTLPLSPEAVKKWVKRGFFGKFSNDIKGQISYFLIFSHLPRKRGRGRGEGEKDKKGNSYAINLE